MIEFLDLKNLPCLKILLNYKRGLPGAARDYFTISLWNSPVQIDLRTLQALGWGLYTNPPLGAAFVCWPPPNSLPFRVFQTGSLWGYPQGSTFGVAPWLGAEPGWNEEPIPNFGVIGCVGPAAGRRTYIHTHTHFHLYILEEDLRVQFLFEWISKVWALLKEDVNKIEAKYTFQSSKFISNESQFILC